MGSDLHVVVIGAGIGGLTLGLALRRIGCNVTILEQAKRLSDVGAGIQLAPNATRILKHLDILSEVLENANQPSGTIVRRYSDDSEIGPPSHTGTKSRFDSPMLVIHRSDLQRVLVEAAIRAGAILRTNARVQDINPDFAAEVTLTNGDIVKGHVLVGADGINSSARAKMTELFGVKDDCTPTGDSAYRVTIPRALLSSYPELLTPLDQGLSTRWIGPHGHIMAYPLRGNTLYNVVMVHASQSTEHDETDLWTRKGSISDLHNFYGCWSPMVQRIAACIDSSTLMQWPLNKRPKLPGWSVNRTTLLGDACHAMLPYVAQGAAQAIEDAAVLAICLQYISNVPHALLVYEGLRKSRAEFIAGCAEDLRRVLHFVDGPEQEERDRTMRAERGPGWKHPDLWSDPGFQDTVWAYNVVEAAKRKCQAIGKVMSKIEGVKSVNEEAAASTEYTYTEGRWKIWLARILTRMANVKLLILHNVLRRAG